MKKILLICLLVLGILTFVLTRDNRKPQAVNVSSTAKLTITQEVSIMPQTHDLGTVVYGDIAHTTFILTNNTNNDLKVTKVSTSCGCTSAKLDSYNIPSHQKTNINVNFNPAIHKDDTDLGDVTRTIFVETDNKAYQKLQVTITAKVIKKGGNK